MAVLEAKIDDFWQHKNGNLMHPIFAQFRQFPFHQYQLELVLMMSPITQSANAQMLSFPHYFNLSDHLYMISECKCGISCCHYTNPTKLDDLYMIKTRKIGELTAWQHQIWLYGNMATSDSE